MRVLLIAFCMCGLVQAEQGGFISGIVLDHSGAAIPGVEVKVQNQQSGARQKLRADAAGYYSTSELSPGTYQITARNDGFRTISRSDVSVIAGKNVRVDLTLELLPLEQEVTVTASQSDNNPMVSGVTVSRGTPSANLPSNGRDLHALFSLMPGATIAPASITGGGQFTVGGQRPNQNSFRVDGVSGNVGIGISSVPGSYPGGSLPAMTTIGGTQSLVTKEEAERVELRSADFSAQSGDRPGAQIDIQTRSGENDFHGSLFGYLRPKLFDSTDWLARGAASNLPPASVNGWGSSLGGPIWRNHTYFFASLERTDVHDSALQIIAVPSAAALLQAGPAYQAVLQAFPSPTGRSLTTDQSVGYSPLQKAAAITASGLRIDHTLNSHVQMFARSSYVPSVSTSIELGTAYSDFKWESVTAGATITYGSFIQQFRFNLSNAASQSIHGPYDAPELAAIYNALGAFSGTITQLSIGGIGQTIDGQEGENSQRQQQQTYSIEKQTGRHDFRIGGDYLNLNPKQGIGYQTLAITSPGIDALLSGVPLGLTNAIWFGPSFQTHNASVFMQDTLHLTSRLSLLWGARWELTPPPTAATLANFFETVGYWRGPGTAPQNTPLSVNTTSNWPMRYDQFAPRMGIAYHLARPDVVVRAGVGSFYDTQMGSIVANENPLATWQYLPAVPNPELNTIPLLGGNPTLYLPRVWEWRTSLEKAVHEDSLLSLSYYGSAGRRLLRNEATIDPSTSVLRTLQFTSHGASDYEAMLAQYRGNITPRLYILASYTWSHSIDTGSSDTEPLLVQPNAAIVDDRGSSSFDVRHVLTASLGYRLKGWTLSSTLFARTGFPFDVTTVDRSIGLGFDNSERVNLIPGVPVWLSDSNVPGGRELNPLAFQAPTSGQNGTLGRNVLVGDGLFQLDTSLRRQLHLFRELSSEVSLSAFNLLNHPAFSSPVSYFGSALFGQSTSTANLMLGSGSPTTGLTPLYQAGGPRTIELGVKFSF